MSAHSITGVNASEAKELGGETIDPSALVSVLVELETANTTGAPAEELLRPLEAAQAWVDYPIRIECKVVDEYQLGPDGTFILIGSRIAPKGYSEIVDGTVHSISDSPASKASRPISGQFLRVKVDEEAGCTKIEIPCGDPRSWSVELWAKAIAAAPTPEKPEAPKETASAIQQLLADIFDLHTAFEAGKKVDYHDLDAKRAELERLFGLLRPGEVLTIVSADNARLFLVRDDDRTITSTRQISTTIMPRFFITDDDLGFNIYTELTPKQLKHGDVSQRYQTVFVPGEQISTSSFYIS